MYQKINGTPKKVQILRQALFFSALSGLIFWGCTTDSAPEPTVKIISPMDGASVVGPNVQLKVQVTHFSFASGALAKTSQVHGEANATGHVHVFLDKPAGLDANAIKNLTKADTVTLTGLSLGKHYIIVAGASATHVDYKNMKDSVMFTVTE